MKYDKKDFHVAPKEGDWGVRLAGGELDPDVFTTRGEAIEFGKEIAREQNVCLVVHSQDGKFEEFDCRPEIRNQHVVHKGHQWAVVEAGGKEISKIFPNKGAAMAHAYDLAVKYSVCMLVHDKDGKFKSVECAPDAHPGILEIIRMKLKR